jgi:hypothetical protein
LLGIVKRGKGEEINKKGEERREKGEVISNK